MTLHSTRAAMEALLKKFPGDQYTRGVTVIYARADGREKIKPVIAAPDPRKWFSICRRRA